MDDSNKPDSPIRMTTIEMDPEDLSRLTTTVTSSPLVLQRLGIAAADPPTPGAPQSAPAFTDPATRSVAQTVIQAIETLAREVSALPSASLLAEPEVQARVLAEVGKRLQGQLTLEGTTALDIAAITSATCHEYAKGTIDIPRVLVTPVGRVSAPALLL